MEVIGNGAGEGGRGRKDKDGGPADFFGGVPVLSGGRQSFSPFVLGELKTRCTHMGVPTRSLRRSKGEQVGN